MGYERMWAEGPWTAVCVARGDRIVCDEAMEDMPLNSSSKSVRAVGWRGFNAYPSVGCEGDYEDEECRIREAEYCEMLFDSGLAGSSWF